MQQNIKREKNVMEQDIEIEKVIIRFREKEEMEQDIARQKSDIEMERERLSKVK